MALRDLIPGSGKGLAQRDDEHPFAALQRQMNELINGFSRGWIESWTRDMQSSMASFAPRVDVRQTDKAVEVTAELPGLTEKDIELSVSRSGDVLTLRGEKKSESERHKGGVYYSERSYGAFTRQVSLPAPVEAGNVEASFKNGVLTVTLPKKPQAPASATHVAVKAG